MGPPSASLGTARGRGARWPWGLAARLLPPPRGLGSPWCRPPGGSRAPRDLQLLWDARAARPVYPSGRWRSMMAATSSATTPCQWWWMWTAGRSSSRCGCEGGRAALAPAGGERTQAACGRGWRQRQMSTPHHADGPGTRQNRYHDHEHVNDLAHCGHDRPRDRGDDQDGPKAARICPKPPPPRPRVCAPSGCPITVLLVAGGALAVADLAGEPVDGAGAAALDTAPAFAAGADLHPPLAAFDVAGAAAFGAAAKRR
jgi:hypothetical protein